MSAAADELLNEKVLGGGTLTPGVREDTATVVMMPLHLITPAADNPRRDVGDITELAESIKAGGIHQPLVVCNNSPRMAGDPEYKIVIGHRRFAAAQLAGRFRVPVLVRKFTEQERLEAMMVENLQRSDLTALEEAGAFKTLTTMGLSQRDIATRIGRSQAHVSRRLALLELPEEAAKALDTGSITLDDAVEITKLADHPKALKEAVGQIAKNPRWVKDTVASQLRKIEEEKKREAAKQNLRAAGVPRLKLQGGPWSLPAGFKWLQGNHYGGSWNSLPFTTEEHQGETCHAGYVDQLGRIAYLCSSIQRHEPNGESELKIPPPPEDPEAAAREAAQAEAKRRQQERADAGEARAAFAKEFLNRGTFALRSTRALEALIEAWLSDNTWSAQERQQTVCELLDIEEGPMEEDGPDYAEALRQWGREWGPSRTERLALAIALTMHDSNPQMTKSHLELLQSIGYQASPVEIQEATPPAEESE
jgi:ParB/RepB/Spo0J family partition protein